MIHCSTLPPNEVIFSHIDEDTGTQTHYAITHALQWIAEHIGEVECVNAVVEAEAAVMIINCRGLEQHRLEPLLAVDNPDPVVFVHMPDDSHLLIDGSHRYAAAWMREADTLRAFILTWEQAQNFIIEGIPVLSPEMVVGGYSGL